MAPPTPWSTPAPSSGWPCGPRPPAGASSSRPAPPPPTPTSSSAGSSPTRSSSAGPRTSPSRCSTPATTSRRPSRRSPSAGLGADELAALSAERSLALDPAELEVIRDHYEAEGRDPTDVELETLAQTWSEHCAHKTFRAVITTDDGTTLPSLLDQLRAATDTVDAPFVRSAFVGNAGIVSFSEGTTVALKAETHNHPSAVEPFGGANTGVGGVIRDVMGAAHRPVAVTDILCFGPPDLPVGELPDGALHPSRIRDGVIDGVADYGNKIGLPTIAGAILYDPAYTTNPLVFCGCIGVADDRPLPTGPFPGDRVVVLGGRTGRDGIRGATFSSATMDATTGAVAGASVQIGDPVTEKLLIDVLTGADHLWTAITDCGAGGLSSAVGEMAERTGADVELTAAPLKYPGLEPWEIWLSEAQERMVVAVPPDRLAELQARCDRHGVELADLGAFTGDGRLVVRHGGAVVLDMATSFLHDGRPKRQMTAVEPTPDRTPGTRTVADPAATLLALLGHRNIASKAATIHRYDHEIGGGTVVRPMIGVAGDGPGDGVVLADPRDTHGLAVGIGVNPWHGLHDPEAMAHVAIDEAIRNVVAVGADPDRVALLDNFSWGDPRRATTLGELVAAVRGCHDAALAHGAPFVSGKDSLNNEYVGNDGQRHAVPPTLVITAVAHVPDVGRCVTAELTAPGNVVVLLGTDGPGVRRQPPRHGARRARRRRRRPPARSRRPRPLPPAARRHPGRARAVVPRPQRGRPRRRAGRAVHLRAPRAHRRRAPPCRRRHRPVRRVGRAPGRRGPPRRPRPARRHRRRRPRAGHGHRRPRPAPPRRRPRSPSPTSWPRSPVFVRTSVARATNPDQERSSGGGA